MKIKFIGYLFLFFSFALAGFSLSKFYKCKISCSLAYINLLSNILEKIDILHLPLSKIFDSLHDPELEKIGYIETLRTDGLKSAYIKFQNKFLFDYEHLEFCDKLGTMSLADTVKVCNYEINRVKKLFDTEKESCEKKIKLYPALAILIGLAIIILII